MTKAKLFLSIILVCSLFLPIILYGQVDTAWVRRYNGPGNGDDIAVSFVIDDSGNVYVTGYSDGLGTGSDFSTIKYNTLGDTQWVRRYNGPANGDDEATAIVIDDSANVYVTGRSMGIGSGFDYATIKYDSSGTEQWVRRYDRYNLHNRTRTLAVDDLANIYVTGYDYNYAMVTIKYNVFGDSQWVALDDSWTINDPRGIVVDDSGNVYVAGWCVWDYLHVYGGYMIDKYNSSGILQWQRVIFAGFWGMPSCATGIALDDSGYVYVTGYNTPNFQDCNYLTIKYNSFGDVQWQQRYPGPTNDYNYATAIAIDDSSNVYVTGRSMGIGSDYDYATIKYNSSGFMRWVARYNGPENSTDNATDITVDDSGNVYVTGYSEGSGTYSDYTTIKYNSYGIEQWVARYNGTADTTDQANKIAVDRHGNVYVTGSSIGTGTSYDYVTIKYTQNVGIREGPSSILDHSTYEIYPNPAKSVMRVRVPLSVKEIKIFDVSGKLVKTVSKVTSGQEYKQEMKISLKGINPGVYILEIGKEVEKVIVVK